MDEAPWGLAVALREKRKAAGITQRGLAEAIGRDFTYISRIERGHDTPSVATAAKIAEAIGVELVPPKPAHIPRGWVAVRTDDLAAFAELAREGIDCMNDARRVLTPDEHALLDRVEAAIDGN